MQDALRGAQRGGKAVIRQCTGNIVMDGLEHREKSLHRANWILPAKRTNQSLNCIAITNDVEIRAGTMTKLAQRNRPVYPGRFVRLTPHLSIIAPTSMEHESGSREGFRTKANTRVAKLLEAF